MAGEPPESPPQAQGRSLLVTQLWVFAHTQKHWVLSIKEAFPALRHPGSEKPNGCLLWPSLSLQRNGPSMGMLCALPLLATVGIPAMLKAMAALLEVLRV